jgi:hypothetical protein
MKNVKVIFGLVVQELNPGLEDSGLEPTWTG